MRGPGRWLSCRTEGTVLPHPSCWPLKGDCGPGVVARLALLLSCSFSACLGGCPLAALGHTTESETRSLGSGTSRLPVLGVAEHCTDLRRQRVRRVSAGIFRSTDCQAMGPCPWGCRKACRSWLSCGEVSWSLEGSEEGVPQGCQLRGPASRAGAPASPPQVLGCRRMWFLLHPGLCPHLCRGRSFMFP